MPRGTLYLVVGPSGAGKDTLIEQACNERRDLIPVRRSITRPADGHEHIPVSAEEFAAQKRANAYALTWDAHGFRYGISRVIEQNLANGQSVIVNGSRTIVAEARAAFQPLRILYVTARFDMLSRRLRGRGREDEDTIERRLGRFDRDMPVGDDVITIDNSGSLEDGVSQFLAALT